MTDELAGDVPVKKLRLIDGRKTNPPRPLGAAGQDLWNRITNDYDISDAGGVELLMQACEAAERAESLRRKIDETGELVHSRTGIRSNPLLRDELGARAFICRTLVKLGLNVEPIRGTAGRPPSGGLGVTWRA
jgi:hypothetical protein